MVIKNSEAAEISKFVYKNSFEEMNKGYNKNYKFLEASAHKDSAEGFFGAAFEKNNTIGKQIVKPIQISVKTSSYNYIELNALGVVGEKILQTIEFRYWQYSKEQHSIENIYQSFNSISGEPTIIVDYEQWPTWTEAKEQFYSHCILESNPSEESDESYIDVFDVLDMFSDPEIADPKLSNVERFRKLAESQRELGNEGLDESFKHMADQTQAVLDALDNKEPNNNGFQFDPSIFEAAKQDFNLNDYLSDEDNNPLSSFQKIMDTVSKQRNNDPSLDNIDLLQNLATDQLHDVDHEFGDLFAQLADQTSAAMEALGIDLNEDDL